MTKAWRLMAVLVGAGSLACTWNVAAQDTEGTPAPRNPFDLTLGLRAEYTDNRDASEDDKEDTFDYYATPRLDAYLDNERTVMDFFYAPSLRYRSNAGPTQNDTELQHALGLNIDHALSERTKVRMKEAFVYQDDPSISEGGIARPNETYYRNRVELGLRQDLSRWSYADLSGDYAIKRYTENEVADESDEDRFGVKGLLWRQLSPTLGARGTLGYSIYTYESALDLNRDFDVLTAALGLDKVFTPQFRGGLDVGVQATEYDDSTLGSATSPYGQVNAQYAPNPAFRINSAFSHGIREADVYPFASQEYSELRGGVEYDPSSVTTVGLNATYRDSEYSDDERPEGAPAPGAGDDDSGNETTLGLGAHSSWKIGDNARLRLRHLYEDVESDVDESFSKNTSTVDLQLDI